MIFNGIEEEVINHKQRVDTKVRQIKVNHDFSLELTDHPKFNLADKGEYKHNGYQGSFLNIPVYYGDVEFYKIDFIKREEICEGCKNERLFDEVYNEYFCPLCDEESWIDKKRRKFFMLMGKL